MKVDIAKVTRSPEMGRMRKVASVGETPTYPNGYVGHTAGARDAAPLRIIFPVRSARSRARLKARHGSAVYQSRAPVNAIATIIAANPFGLKRTLVAP